MLLGKCRNMAFHVHVNTYSLPDECRDVACHVWVTTASNTLSQGSDMARHVPTIVRPITRRMLVVPRLGKHRNFARLNNQTWHAMSLHFAHV